ncbi:MarR family winged helix-turn-helix transcriptional regulator [Jiangella asiatica]|uniref:MarR family transcriptional regulator n=1 Tax=Jiangella asiatica TaxID=2530372 RepID=A0A4R5DJT3_9ACTN|nr:MarR family transcriptional regulator [Jiangella asiatica]TDE12224.1 MarR family transcriptional regulator [Jiangella asiatica]
MSESAEGEFAASLEAFLRQIGCARAESDLNSMVALDLSISQLRCLMALSRHTEPIPINELADELDLTLATAGRNVDRLVAHGLVVRREDPHDRRVRRVSLSEAGRDVIVDIDAARQSALRAYARSLHPVDRERLQAALAPIVNATPSQLEDHHS